MRRERLCACVVFLAIAIGCIGCSVQSQSNPSRLDTLLHYGTNHISVDAPGIYLVACKFSSNISVYEFMNPAKIRFAAEQPMLLNFKEVDVRLGAHTGATAPILFFPGGRDNYFTGGGAVIMLIATISCSSKCSFDLDLTKAQDRPVSETCGPSQYLFMKLGHNLFPQNSCYFYRTTRAISKGCQLKQADYSIGYYPPEVPLKPYILPTLLLDTPLGMTTATSMKAGHDIESKDLVLPTDSTTAAKFLRERNLVESAIGK